MNKIKTDALRLAELRYYEKEYDGEKSGTEVLPVSAYAFLMKVENKYINVLNPENDFPVWGRVPYSNTTKSGEDYGTKITLLSGKEEDGLCYVLWDIPMSELFWDKKEISLKDIEYYVLHSSKFFIDRMKLIEKRLLTGKLYQGVYEKDLEKKLEFDTLIAEIDQRAHTKKK